MHGHLFWARVAHVFWARVAHVTCLKLFVLRVFVAHYNDGVLEKATWESFCSQSLSQG